MNVFALDESQGNLDSLKKKIKGLKTSKTSKDLIKKLEKADECNILFVGVFSFELIDWIVHNNKIIRNIIIYMDDKTLADKFSKILRREKYKVSHLPLNTLLDNLENSL